jgi:hypothetical protein
MKQLPYILSLLLSAITLSAQPFESVTYKVFNLNLYHYSPNSPDTKYTNIPVWDSPVMIMDKSALELLSPDGDRKNLEKDFNTEM